MRIVVQNVNKAEVYKENVLVSSINKGIVVYIGVERDEPQESKDWLVQKLKELNPEEILCLSQFTLFGTLKKKSPSFHKAETADIAREYFYSSYEKIKECFPVVKKGIFRENLEIRMTECFNTKFYTNKL